MGSDDGYLNAALLESTFEGAEFDDRGCGVHRFVLKCRDEAAAANGREAVCGQAEVTSAGGEAAEERCDMVMAEVEKLGGCPAGKDYEHHAFAVVFDSFMQFRVGRPSGSAGRGPSPGPEEGPADDDDVDDHDDDDDIEVLDDVIVMYLGQKTEAGDLVTRFCQRHRRALDLENVDMSQETCEGTAGEYVANVKRQWHVDKRRDALVAMELERARGRGEREGGL